MGAERVAVNSNEMSAWFNHLSSIVDGIPREFVFKSDETGCWDHTDSRKVPAIALIDYPYPWIPVPYNAHSKRSTFIVCIAVDGFRMTPFAIVPHFTTEKEFRYYRCDE
jgi:hypothetical protein